MYGCSGITNCPVGLKHLVYGRTEGQVYKNGQEKVNVVKDLPCLTKSDGIYSIDQVKPLEAFCQGAARGFPVSKAMCLGEELSDYCRSSCCETGPDESSGVR